MSLRNLHGTGAALTCARLLLSLLLVGLMLESGLADEGKAPPPGKFRQALVERGTITASVQAIGTVQPESIVDVGAQVAGTVLKLGPDPRDPKKTVDVGTAVEAGTILAEVDPALYRVELDRAEANLERARADLKLSELRLAQAERNRQRAEKLQAQKAISETDLAAARDAQALAQAENDVRKAAIRQAEAAVRHARTNLDYCTIRSPVKGIVLDRRVNRGQAVVASLSAPSLFLIAEDLKKMQVWTLMPEADIGQVRKGQPVRFTVNALPRDSFQGKVSQIRLNATQSGRVVTYTVVVDTDNADGKLLPYLTAHARLEVGQHKNVLLVPNTALSWRPPLSQIAPDARDACLRAELEVQLDAQQAAQKKRPRELGLLWVADKGFVRPVKVRVRMSDDQKSEVEGDLSEGKSVVIGMESDD